MEFPMSNFNLLISGLSGYVGQKDKIDRHTDDYNFSRILLDHDNISDDIYVQN